MNCKHVEELLPLYVGRDLEQKPANLVTSHLQSCAECAALANEYQETRQLLQKFEPPLFNEAIYTGIRQRVLREIERESSLPGLPQLIASVLRPRLRLAIATSLMLAISALAFYFIPTRTNDRQQVAESRHATDQKTGDERPKEVSQRQGPVTSSPSFSKKKDGPPLMRNMGTDTRIAGAFDPTQQPQRRKSSGVTADRARSLAVNTPSTRSLTTKGSPGNNITESHVLSGGNQATPEKTLRVEIQTKDPNVRIIWFSHPRVQQESESFQGI